jgi:lipoprotein-releasing system permease protein
MTRARADGGLTRARRRAGAAMQPVLFVALRQLWNRKLLNGIAVGGVTIGVAVFVAMPALMLGYQVMFFEVMLKTSSHVVLTDTELRPRPALLEAYAGAPVAERIAHEVPSDRQRRIKRPDEIVRAMRARGDVEGAAASLAGMVLIEFGGRTKSVDLRGIDVAAQDRVTPLRQFVAAGKLDALATVADAIAVGSGVAKDLGLHLGDVVHAAAPGGRPMSLEVVAILDVGVPPIDKTRGYTLLRTAQALLGRPDTIGRIEVRLADPDAAVAAAATYERIFGYDAESWQETNANFLTLFATQNAVIGFVIGAILLVGGFGILSILIMIVLQKQRDIAILRSIGLRAGDILRVFLLQGLVVAAAGGVLGDVLGKLAIWYIPRIKMSIEGVVKADSLPVHEDPRFYVWGLAFALVLGTVAALLPAWRASRVEPVDVLRGQIG